MNNSKNGCFESQLLPNQTIISLIPFYHELHSNDSHFHLYFEYYPLFQFPNSKSKYTSKIKHCRIYHVARTSY